MFDILANWLKRRRDCSELAILGSEEFSRLAHDIGISTRELEYLVSESHDPKQLPRMLNALGIDAVVLRRTEPALLRDLQRGCALCGAISECRHALDLWCGRSNLFRLLSQCGFARGACASQDTLTAGMAQQAETSIDHG